jgi:GNAT superfamily N-acetyltransferase
MVRVRSGQLRDLPQLEIIERETATMFPPSALPPELAEPVPEAELAAGIAASLLWIADSASAGPVGFVVCERFTACLHVREMDVRPSFGRRGIGTRLLLHACAAAKNFGLRFVTLTTFSHLPWNAPFYARHGFVVVQSLDAFPHLEAALRHESDRGLEHRVAMVRTTYPFRANAER